MKNLKHFRFPLHFRFTTTIFVSLALLLSFVFYSCRSIPKEETKISRELLGTPVLNATELANYFLSQNPNEDKKHITQFALYYIQEAAAEGINSDVAFAQMCLETGYLTFGNLVTAEMHNYCGLGAIDAEHPGERFETEQLGIRAHIQHLQAYATTEDVKLNNELIDPRYNWVHKTKLANNVYDFAGTWAADKQYGEKLNAILDKMQKFVK